MSLALRSGLRARAVAAVSPVSARIAAADVVATAAAPPAPASDETWLERLAKLIPGDVVTLYVTAIGFAATTSWRWYTLAVAIGCTVLTPVLLYFDTRPGRVPVAQYIIRTLAFIAWAFAISQPLAPLVIDPIVPALVALLLPLIAERVIR